MAMASNTWYTITLAALAAPPYTAGTYTLPPAMVDLIISGSAFHVFCIFDAGAGAAASVAFVGGSADIPSDAVTIATTPAMDTTTMNDGENWYSVRAGAAGWYFYGDQSGTVRALTDSTVLGAFIS